MNYHVVKFTGPFGFIKPWTAVRDSETFSQQFLTPSILEGIRQKLGVKEILRHKLTYSGISSQQEQTQPRGWEYKKTQNLMTRSRSILVRGVMINPELYLAFASEEAAAYAAKQHICLCRNEDVLLPSGKLMSLTEPDFNELPGFELRFGDHENAFLVGYNRFEEGNAMHGWLEVTGSPVRSAAI